MPLQVYSEKNPKPWVLRLFALSWGGMAATGAILAFRAEVSPAWGYALSGLSLAFAFGIVSPKAMSPLYGLVEKGLRPVGHVVSVVMLALVYFGFFTPFALVLRLFGWDPLQIRASRALVSGWVSRPKGREESGYKWLY